jgi:hypothetical protein
VQLAAGDATDAAIAKPGTPIVRGNERFPDARRAFHMDKSRPRARVEEMLATQGISVTHETIRQWGLKFGRGTEGSNPSPSSGESAKDPAVGDSARRRIKIQSLLKA